ncbi:MAG: hypothetical protein RLP44_00080 [Aggregatilineales bacterium]
MSWRLHLTNQAIQSLEIVDGDPPILVVWSRRDRVAYYGLMSGTPYGEISFEVPIVENRQEETWQTFLNTLIVPNDAYLPVIHTPSIDIYTTDDGRMRLYHVGDAGLFLESDGKEIALEVEGVERFRAVALDRFLGLSAAIDDEGKLHIYQQHIRVGAFDLGLTMDEGLKLSVAISRGGGAIFVSDGQRVVLTDSSGRIRKKLEPHYFIGDISCSPNGKYLVMNDIETGVLRVYSGTELQPLHQRFAIDLLAEATQTQLIADLPPMMVGLSALTMDNKKQIAFAMSGVICVTDTEHMDDLPRPQPLL